MSPATALIVDDSAEVRRLLKRSLVDLGFVIIEAANGSEAVQLARQCHPAIVVLDLCLPGMDGWDVVACLRSDPALEEVPIVVVTAYYGSSIIQAARRAGCQHVIAKPFQLRDITRVITALTSSIDVCMPRYA
jgi:CheY-like chemotaxis protein